MKLKRIAALVLVLCMVLSIPAFAASSAAKKVVAVAKSQIGKPYSLSSDPPSSYNCASLVRYCYNRVKSGTITGYTIHHSYKTTHSKSNLQAGDIVCFKIASDRKPNVLNYHFGIYAGKGYFIHALTGRGVVCTKLNSYDGRYLGAIRIF